MVLADFRGWSLGIVPLPSLPSYTQVPSDWSFFACVTRLCPCVEMIPLRFEVADKNGSPLLSSAYHVTAWKVEAANAKVFCVSPLGRVGKSAARHVS